MQLAVLADRHSRHVQGVDGQSGHSGNQKCDQHLEAAPASPYPQVCHTLTISCPLAHLKHGEDCRLSVIILSFQVLDYQIQILSKEQRPTSTAAWVVPRSSAPSAGHTRTQSTGTDEVPSPQPPRTSSSNKAAAMTGFVVNCLYKTRPFLGQIPRRKDKTQCLGP